MAAGEVADAGPHQDPERGTDRVEDEKSRPLHAGRGGDHRRASGRYPAPVRSRTVGSWHQNPGGRVGTWRVEGFRLEQYVGEVVELVALLGERLGEPGVCLIDEAMDLLVRGAPARKN